MLMQLRKPVAKVLTFLLFAVLILSFAVWGIGDIFQGSGRNTAVAVVGDSEIDRREFTRSLTRELNRLQSSLGSRLGIEEARALGLVDQILQQLISRALFDQKADDLGMVVSEAQIREGIIAEPAFHNQLGEFDRGRLIQVLRASNLSEEQFILSLQQDIKRQQIASAAVRARTVPEDLAKALYAYAQEQRVGETIAIALDSIEEPADPDETVLKAFHGERSGSFMTPETRSLTLIQLRAEDLSGEISIADEEIEAEYEARRQDFITPERRSLQQIVLDNEEDAQAARAELDGGADFAAVAESALGSAPIELGTFSETELAAQFPELAEAAFARADGGASLAESSFGWHVLLVTEIVPGSERSFEEVREDLRHELAMRQAVDSMISIANQMDDELGGGAPLEEAAERLNLSTRRIAALDSRGNDADGNEIEGLPPLDDFLPVVRETQPGEESLLTETRDGNYFILRVDGVTPAAERPLEEVRDDVIALWKDSERDRLARERAEALEARAEEGVQLIAIAQSEALPFVEREPLTRTADGAAAAGARELAATLFALKEGEVGSFRAGDSYYVTKLVEVRAVDPSADPETMDRLTAQLAGSLENDLLAQFSAALRQTYDISVNAQLIDEVLTTSY